jgi:hypothetical protein
MRDIQAELTRQSLAESRHLALETGSAISASPADASSVLASTQPVLGFLLGGDNGDQADLLARRRAVRRHLANLKDSTAARVLRGTDPQAFLEQARAYYAFYTAPPGSDAAFAEITARLDDPELPEKLPDDAPARVLALVRDSGEQGISAARVYDQLAVEGFCVRRETLQLWLTRYVQEGFIVPRSAAGAFSRRVTYRAVPEPGEQS